MNKPDWQDAPKWAEYLYRDELGAWWWVEDGYTWDDGFQPYSDAQRAPAVRKFRPHVERRL